MQPRHPRKRNRPVLSCGQCRSRKLKCDRSDPCSACVRAGDAATCSYRTHEVPRVGQSSAQIMERDALTSRIDRLEALLLSSVNMTPASSGSPSSAIQQSSAVSVGINHDIPSDSHTVATKAENERENADIDRLGKEFGLLRVEAKQTLYHGGQHWVSTMFQIQEFRDYLEANSDDLGRIASENQKAREVSENAISLLKGTNPLTKEELLTSLPSRVVTDILLARFFSYVSNMIPVVHEATFREEYIEHWKNPHQTEVTWLGLLFSILHHAQLSFRLNDPTEGNHSERYIAEYRQRTVQCLVTAGYTDPQANTVETLILHIYAEWMCSQDSNIELSLLVGILIRLAMRMGMHRDSKTYGEITPFRGEMRRRVWAIIRNMDIVCSFQLSLPATIHHTHSRCAIPRNIFNAELGKDIAELPPTRPLSEATEISTTIIKTRLTNELGKILAFIESEDEPTDDDIFRYQQSLEEVKRVIPRRLEVSPTEELTIASAALHRQRIDLDRLYQTSKCVLHRKSLSQARQDSTKLKHRGLCMDASLSLLAHQATLYLKLNPASPQNIRNRHIYSLTTHDFFTAAMAVALDLYYGFELEPIIPSPSDISLWGYDRRDEMIAALETSIEFCRISKEESVEAANAYGMLTFLVPKAKKAQWTIAERQIRENSDSAEKNPIPNTATSVSGLGAEIFDGPLPDFDWSLWNQFNEDLPPFTQWEAIL